MKKALLLFAATLMSTAMWGQKPERPRAATLAQQKMCSDQANKIYQDYVLAAKSNTPYEQFTAFLLRAGRYQWL